MPHVWSSQQEKHKITACEEKRQNGGKWGEAERMKTSRRSVELRMWHLRSLLQAPAVFRWNTSNWHERRVKPLPSLSVLVHRHVRHVTPSSAPGASTYCQELAAFSPRYSKCELMSNWSMLQTRSSCLSTKNKAEGILLRLGENESNQVRISLKAKSVGWFLRCWSWERRCAKGRTPHAADMYSLGHPHWAANHWRSKREFLRGCSRLETTCSQ